MKDSFITRAYTDKLYLHSCYDREKGREEFHIQNSSYMSYEITHDPFIVAEHYVNAMLWITVTDYENETYMQENYSIEDLAPETMEAIKRIVVNFLVEAFPLLDNYRDTQAEQIGHDLFLNTQGYGVGFFDRVEYSEEDKEKLEEIVSKFTAHDFYIGDDDLIYMS